MGTGSGSKVSAGCGAFGLLGVLITVGIVAWLFVTSTDLLPSGSGRDRPGSMTTTSTEGGNNLVTITVDPASNLGAAPDVTVTAGGWAPGSNVTISTCLGGAGLVLSGESPCDGESAVILPVDAGGSISSAYRVDRIVTAGGLPYDCADGGITCAVRATGTTAGGRPASGETLVAFQLGLPAPDLLEELGG